MDKDVRASVLAAIAAAALSALIGIIAGVGFLVLVFRALALGLVLGAAVYGIIFLLRKMVPEALSLEDHAQSSEEASLTPDAMSGTKLDIVLPGDENPEALSSLPPAYASESSPEDSQSLGAADFPLASGSDDLGTASLLDAETSASAVIETALPANASFGGFRGGDDLDVLPDIDGFSDSFSASEASPVPSGAASQSDSSSSSGSGMDPASLAQAVRTILKRDQKG